MNNKKGISAIVATVLIILITVAAVTIIWAAIIPMISEQLGAGTVCVDAMSQITIENEGGFTCYDAAIDTATCVDPDGTDYPAPACIVDQAGCTACSATGVFTDVSGLMVNVQVGHGPTDVDLTGIQVLVTTDGDTVTFDSNDLPGINAERVISVDYDAHPDTTVGDIPDSVKIAPVVGVGNVERSCDATPSIELDLCS